MPQRTIEGTWEDIASKGADFAGHRVRLTILDDDLHAAHTPASIAPRTVKDPIVGMFAEVPDLIDEIVEEAMTIRESRPGRLPASE